MTKPPLSDIHAYSPVYSKSNHTRTKRQTRHKTDHLDAFLGPRGGRVFGTGEQVLSGSGRGGRGEHHARHLHQELFGRHSRYHSINAVSQQGNNRLRESAVFNKFTFNKISIKFACIAN